MTIPDPGPWKPRAVRGVDVTSEITGLVRTLHFKSGDEVKEGQSLVQLNADADIAQLRSLEAAAELARASTSATRNNSPYRP